MIFNIISIVLFSISIVLYSSLNKLLEENKFYSASAEKNLLKSGEILKTAEDLHNKIEKMLREEED